jgi:ADP-ribose pyrophosphatase YjhB (NUDIX family)
VVRDDVVRVLLVRRTDTGDWELPGGWGDVGESAVDAEMSEVAEESGLVINVLGIAALHSDPTPHGAAELRRGDPPALHGGASTPPPGRVPSPDYRETSDARWWAVPDADALPVQPAVRCRLRDALTAHVQLD